MNYQQWVEAFARNHTIPIEWAAKDVRKEAYVQPHLRRMERTMQYGVLCLLKSPFLLRQLLWRQLMLPAPMATLLGHDVGVCSQNCVVF
jgi:hypothetical protein